MTTLEAFFQAVAQALFVAQRAEPVQKLSSIRAVFEALFEAQPLSSLSLGGEPVFSGVQFDRPLINKEDLLFSAVAVAPGQLWVGTLGGGLRRIDGRGATPQDTRHLTHLDGLPSNLILALAVAPDGALWVATDKGVSRLREEGSAVTITTFAALDGLALPVRDVAVDAAGTVWLATDRGLFRIVPQGSTVQGLVVDAFSRPVVGANVTLRGTPFHAVTDARGRFVLANLPAGPQQVQVDGRLAVERPFAMESRAITVPDGGTQTLETIILKPQPNGPAPFEGTGVPDRAKAQLLEVSGNNQRGIPGAELPKPLVVRLEDQFGNPLPGETVTGKIIAGDGTLLPGITSSVTVTTDAAGTAAFRLRFGTSALTITEVTASGLPGTVAPVQFLTLVGLITPVSIAAEPNGRFVLVDPAINAVLRVNQHQIGTVITISDDNPTYSGPLLQLPYGIARAADGALLVTDAGLQAVLRVDPSSGNRTIISDATHGMGPRFQIPVQVAVASDGALIVTDSLLGLQAVLRVDPSNGNRTIISDATQGMGPPLLGPIGVAVAADGSLVITDVGLTLRPAPAVRWVNPRSGDRTTVSGCIDSDCTAIVGGGPPLSLPGGIAIEADGSLIVADVILNAVLRVDPRSGNRTVVSGCIDSGCTAIVGGGERLQGPAGVIVVDDGALVVTDGALTSAKLAAVLRVDPRSGYRTIIAQGATTRGNGPSFLGGQAQLLKSLYLQSECLGEAIAIEADGSLVMTDTVLKAVLRVHPRSGDREIVSDVNMGSGPDLQDPGGITVATDGSLVVIDGLFDPSSSGIRLPPPLLRVDPRSGDRTIVSDATSGRGPLWPALGGVAEAADGSLIVTSIGMINPLSGATHLPPILLRVDPHSGNRTPVSGCIDSGCTASIGRGSPLLVPVGIV